METKIIPFIPQRKEIIENIQISEYNTLRYQEEYHGLIYVTLDIESIILKGVHIPHIITISNGTDPVFTFRANKKRLLHGNYKQEVTRLFTRTIKFLIKYGEFNKKVNIYVHNLGSYPAGGTFICRELLNSDSFKSTDIKILLDKHHKFICIEYKKLKFLDSCRLSGGQSLKNICKIWKVESPTPPRWAWEN